MSRSLEHQLEVSRLETLYEQSSSAVLANFLCGLGVFAILPKGPFIATWAVLLITTLLARGWLYRRFRRAPTEHLDPARWFRLYGCAIAVTGSLWGAVGAYAAHAPTLGDAFFTVAVLVGLVGGSVATCAVSPAIFLAFTAPTLLPPSIALMLMGD
ncbi:MAG: hypothetical protein AAFX50_22840, partial [Acidobacteriota bacterium]